MREYQYAATRLALLRDRIDRGLDRDALDRAQSAYEEAELLRRISANRQVFIGRDPQTPAAHWDGSQYHVTFPDGVRRALAAPPEPVMPIPIAAPPVRQPPPAPWPSGWPSPPRGYGPYG
jgi:hypothetical protein